MAYNTTPMTVAGNLTADPDLTYTPSGAAVTNVTVASTPRYFDRQANEFKDAETLFVRVTLWRELAENVCESLRKGMRVVAHGTLKARAFTDREGNPRTAWELDAEDFGASLKHATAQVTRTQRQQGGQGGGFAPQGGQGASYAPQGAADPWGQQPQAQGGWGTPQTEEPPF